MLYLAWDREINISLFFCDVFVWKWGPRPRTSSRCYHGNKSAATFKKGTFVHPPWVPNCMQNLKGGWKFSFPKIFDSYRDFFLTPRSNLSLSLLLIIQILWCKFREFSIGLTKYPQIDIFLYSNHSSGWYCIDIVRRNSVLVTHGS